LEKSLNSVVNKWYILSIWRLYHIINNIKNNKKIYDYWISFKKYLEKYDYLQKVLLDDKFFKIFKQIIETEVFWKKRHSGQISFVETRKARKLIIWNLKNKESLIYMLLSTQDVEF
jgi:hypothetical protein